ncbi:MAG: glutathione S-transferase [Alphaproteobacteria bacterium]|nr:glutathione S-transferase [Alphaproteobacteria bacterium]
MKLYMTEMSGNSFKVRVLAAILGVELEQVRINWEGGEHKSPSFLALNPRGQVPVMEIEDRIFWDSTAHLVYLARRFGGEDWLPSDPLDEAEVMQWMSFAQDEVQFGLQWARGVTVYDRRPDSFAGYLEDGRTALAVLERQLERTDDWLALGRATLADIACYPYVKRAPEGDLPLDDYPAVRAWLERCEALPGWFAMDP